MDHALPPLGDGGVAGAVPLGWEGSLPRCDHQSASPTALKESLAESGLRAAKLVRFQVVRGGSQDSGGRPPKGDRRPGLFPWQPSVWPWGG